MCLLFSQNDLQVDSILRGAHAAAMQTVPWIEYDAVATIGSREELLGAQQPFAFRRTIQDKPADDRVLSEARWETRGHFPVHG